MPSARRVGLVTKMNVYLFNRSLFFSYLSSSEFPQTEGFFCLENERIDVRVHPGDVVIDAGSWIGDFAAYASVKGATVYAFEPIEAPYRYLLETARLNANILPVKKGLGDSETQAGREIGRASCRERV